MSRLQIEVDNSPYRGSITDFNFNRVGFTAAPVVAPRSRTLVVAMGSSRRSALRPAVPTSAGFAAPLRARSDSSGDPRWSDTATNVVVDWNAKMCTVDQSLPDITISDVDHSMSFDANA